MEKACPHPSEAIVEETSMTACRMMKMISKQLMILCATYKKVPFEKRKCTDKIYKTMKVVVQSISKMQESLIESGTVMNADIDETDATGDTQFPSEVVITLKEYRFLNAVFLEYISERHGSSDDFSLFSRSNVYPLRDSKIEK